MDKKQASPELLQAEPLPTQEEQFPANPPSRKRQIDSDSDAGDKPKLKRARLTRKNLACFNKMGEENKKEPRKSSSSHRDSTSVSQKTKTTSTTTSGFADQAYKNGILPPLHSKPPANLKNIQEQHGKSRTTASPTESDFERYSNKVGRAPNKSTMVVETTRRIIKDYNEQYYHQSFNQSFTGFPKEVGFNDGLSAAQPDYVEGLEKAGYDPFPIEHVPGAVLYEDDPDSLALPHLAGEYKARRKNMEEARLQSSYNGAALVYARNQALSYMGKSDPPGYAEVTTFTTDGTTLNQYAHYAEKMEDGTTKYHQYRIKSTNLIDSHQEFKDGRRGLRNAQDYARDQSYALKNDLREYWEQQRSTLQPIREATPLPIPGYDANTLEEEDPYQTSYGASAHEEIAVYEETATYNGEADYAVVDQPHSKRRSPSKNPASNQPTEHLLSKHSSSKSSHQASSSDGHKRKASQPSPPGSGHVSKHPSKHKNYWNLDDKSGCYYHKHSDGTISWFKGEGDDPS